MAEKREERKKRVMVGDLPDDFLRVSVKPELPTGRDAAPVSFRPSNIAGTLSITIVNADLVKNYGLTKMDPYVRVRIGHDVYETQTALRGSKHPSWNRTIQSYLPQGIQTVFFDVYDERVIGPDERIAWGSLVLPAQLFKGEFLNTSIPLSGKQGEGEEGKLHVICNFAPSSVHVSSMTYPSAPLMMLPNAYYNSFPYYSNMPYAMNVSQPWSVNPQYTVQAAQPNSAQQLSATEVQQLQEMFPSFDKETIISVLESCGHNKDQAVNTLLSMTSE